MSKKTAIIITLAATILAVVGLVAWYLFLSPQNNLGGESGINKLISTFFPAGEQTVDNRQETIDKTAETDKEKIDPNEGQPAPAIREISPNPVAGFVIVEDKKSSTTVRYMESETGHIYSALLATISKKRLTNTTIPKVREAIFLPNGEKLIARYLDEDNVSIKSFAGTINLPKTEAGLFIEGELQGEFLVDDIVDITATNAEKIFYTIVENGGAAGIIANSNGSKPARVFSSPIREWLPQWAGDNLYLATKASSNAPGHLFKINTSNGSQTKIIGSIFGMTTNVNPKNTDIIYSDGSLKLKSYNLKTKKISELALQTLAEKCAWEDSSDVVIYCGIPNNMESGEHPDDWYKGLVGFKDDLWRMNLTTGEITFIAQFDKVSDKPIDIINPKVSKDGNYLVFTNKNDLSLWSVRVR